MLVIVLALTFTIFARPRSSHGAPYPRVFILAFFFTAHTWFWRWSSVPGGPRSCYTLLIILMRRLSTQPFTSCRLVISHFSRLFFVYPAIDVSFRLQFCHYLRFDRKSKIIALPSLFPQLMIIFISYRTARLWITFLLNLDVHYPSEGIVPDLILIRITSFLNILHLVIDQPK